MVYVARLVSGHAGVDAGAIVDDEQEGVTVVRSLVVVARVGLLVRDPLAHVLDYARSHGYWTRGVYAAAVYARAPHHESLVVTDQLRHGALPRACARDDAKRILTSSYGDRCLDGRVSFVACEFEVLEPVLEDRRRTPPDHESRQRQRRAAELQPRLLEVVGVQVAVATGPDELTDLEAASAPPSCA